MNKWLLLSVCLIGLLIVSNVIQAPKKGIVKEEIIQNFLESYGGVEEYRINLFNNLITKQEYQGVLNVRLD